MKIIINKCILILGIMIMIENSIPVVASEQPDLLTDVRAEILEGQESETVSGVVDEGSKKSDKTIVVENMVEEENVDSEEITEDFSGNSGEMNEEKGEAIQEFDPEHTDVMNLDNVDGSGQEEIIEPDAVSETGANANEILLNTQEPEPNGGVEPVEDDLPESAVTTDSYSEGISKDGSEPGVIDEPKTDADKVQTDIQATSNEEPKPGEDDPQGGTSMSNQEISSPIALFSVGPIGSGYVHNSRYNSGYDIVNGIDVSRYNGNIDWSQVKASGIEYAMIRVGFRGYGSSGSLNEDSMFRQNIEGALNAGLKVGVYFFSQAITRTEARAEANYVLDRIYGYNISLPVVIDYEYASGNIGRLYEANLSRDYATQICKAFCGTVESAGYTGMVYANKSMLENNLYADEISSDYKIWLAHYTTQTSYAGDYYAWQYTSSGQIDGVAGNVDCNFFYEKKQVQVTTEDAERYISHLYDVLFERSADTSGLASYTTALKNGTATASSVANTLISSNEFQNKQYSDDAYVKKLYLALLGRNAGISEVKEWTEKLETGVSRTYILAQIAGSEEFQNICNSYKIPQGSIAVTENRDKNYYITAYVARCYQTILERTADTSGLNTWTGKILGGDGGAEIVRDLLLSQEFKNKKKSDRQVIEILYKAMLNRASDSNGRAYWLGYLEDGVSYVYVINGFSGSPEFVGLCNEYGIAAGQAAVTEARDRNIGVTQFVNRNYQIVLNRNGEVSGLNYWCEAILDRIATPEQVAYGFVFSDECKSRGLDNDKFVEMLYNVCLGRESESDGKRYWVSRLDEGLSKETVFWGFANSAEFRKIVEGYGL